MNVKTQTLAIISALAVSLGAVGAASAAVIVPAKFVEGTLTAVDVAHNTVSIDGVTYATDRAVDVEGDIGTTMTLTLVMAKGQLRAVWVEPTIAADDTVDAE